MKLRLVLVTSGLLLLLLSAESLTQAVRQTRLTRLFDGKTFAGWEGDLKTFRIENGAIVGGTLKEKIPRNEFLCTQREYRNFTLTLEFKVLGEGANAGVQFRTRRIPNHHEVIGYQADLGEGWYGALYDESRRKTTLAKPDSETLNKAIRRGEWNQYLIQAEGPHIQLFINGVKTVDYIEQDAGIEQRGCICLQIHGGPPSEAWYRKIAIRPLPETP